MRMKKIFTLVSVLCACVVSAFAQAPELNVEGEWWSDTMYVTIPYEKTQLDRNDDGIADEWLAGSREYFENNVWGDLEKEGAFTFNLQGTSPFTGKLMIVIADDSEEANNWATLTESIYFEVEKDKEFVYTGYTRINNLELQTTNGENGNIGDEVKGGLTNPKYFMAAFPEDGVEEGTDIKIPLTRFQFRYSGPKEILSIPIPDIEATLGDVIEPIKLTDYFINPYDTEMWFEIERYDQEEETYPPLFQAKVDGEYLRISALDDGTNDIMIIAYAIDPESEYEDWPYTTQNNTIQIKVKKPTPLDGSECDMKISFDFKTISCSGKKDGSIVATVTGGVEPYSYRWNTGRTSNGIYNVGYGYYYVTVVDSVGCTAYEQTYFEEPFMSYNYKKENPTCGNEDGSITFLPDDFNENYTYTWSTGATGTTLENLAAGTYTVTITDENGCTEQETICLQYKDASTFDVRGISASSCTSNDGRLYLNNANEWGENITMYMNDTEVTSFNAVNMAPGIYNFAIVDNETGCRNEQTVEIGIYPFPEPEVYAVTYSEDSKSVVVMWTYDYTYYDNGKTEELLSYLETIDYFTVYRETSEGKGEYDSVGYAKADFPLFQDENLPETNGSYRYKISATDKCGRTSSMGCGENKTIGLTMDTTVVVSEDGSESTTVDLSWTPYEGKFLEAYLIYRITKDGNLEAAKVGPLTTHYTEKLPAGTKGYFIAVKFCDTLYLDENNVPGLKAESGPFSLAMSNVAELENADAVSNVEKQAAFVYSAHKSIIVKGAQKLIAVYDLQGRIVAQQKANQGVATIPMAKDGIYIVVVDGQQAFEVFVK